MMFRYESYRYLYPPRPEIVVEPELLDNFVGRYCTHFKIRLAPNELQAKLGASGMVEVNIPYSAVEYWIGG